MHCDKNTSHANIIIILLEPLLLPSINNVLFCCVVSFSFFVCCPCVAVSFVVCCVLIIIIIMLAWLVFLSVVAT